jgi:hypothetical protein
MARAEKKPVAPHATEGPMAYAMMGGIIVGTMLTLLFLPALYVAWFRIKEPKSATDNTHEKPTAPKLQADLSADAPSQRSWISLKDSRVLRLASLRPG